MKNQQTQTIETTDSLSTEIESLKQQIAVSSEAAAALELELMNLPAQLHQATLGLDVEETVRLQRRHLELPLYVKAEQIKNTRLRIRADELYLSQIEDKPVELYEPLQEAEKRFIEARDARARASDRWQSARDDISETKVRIGHQKLRLEKLEGEMMKTSGSGATPLARSGWR